MATSVEDCKTIVNLCKKTGLKYMMMETVVYAREFLRQRALREGQAGQNSVSSGEPPAGHGWLAKLLARAPPHALRDALRRSMPGTHQCHCGVCFMLWLGDHPQGSDQALPITLRRRDHPHQIQGF